MLSSSELTNRLEQNSVNIMLHWASFCPGAVITRTPSVTTFRTGIRHYMANGVASSDISHDEMCQLAEDLMVECRSDKVPYMWFIHPSRQPAGWRSSLDAAGFEKIAEMPGMIADLSQGLESHYAVDKVEIRQVDSESMLMDWWNTCRKVFDLPDALKTFFTGSSITMGIERKTPIRNYVAYLDDIPVATSTLFLDQGVGGIYCVGTLDSMRGRGIGRAITLAAMKDAFEMGAPAAVLLASEMGEPIYKKLGFIEACRFEMWAAHPDLEG